MNIARTQRVTAPPRRYVVTMEHDDQEHAAADDLATSETHLSRSTTGAPATGRKADELLRAQVHNALFGDVRSAPRLGRYVYLKQLGAGGMGVVFAAYDPELDRKVAVKLIHTSAAESVEHRARMLREAQAMARLSHPNVLQVYEITEIDGEICVVMEYVDGQTLGEWAGGEPRGWRAVIECYLQFAAGLAAAHAEGIVHRDVKPDNAIIDRDGRVRVLDFGIAQTDAARGVDGVRVAAAGLDALAPLKTRTGALLGTPAYMSPEHVEGRGIDARSDQFSLCASLYEALYGRRPFRGDTLQQLIAAMLDEPLAPPPARTEVPSWVHDIVARGLSRDPKDRWPSLDALADALRDDPVARRRQRLWIGGGLALAAGAALAGWMAYTGGVEARAAEARAQESEAQARAVEERSAAALRESYLGSLGHGGYVELQTLDNPLRALVMLNEVYRDRPGDLHLRELLAVASRPADAHEWSAEAHASAVGAIAVSPDGALVASADKHALRVWDAASGDPVATAESLGSDVSDLQFSPDGARVVATSYRGDIGSWVPRTGEQLVHMPGDDGYLFVPISPDATRIARNTDGLTGVEIVDVVRGEVVSTLPADSAFAMAWSADSRRLALRTISTRELWDVSTGARLRDLKSTNGIFGRGMANGRNARIFDDGVGRFVFIRDGKPFMHDTEGGELALAGEVEDSGRVDGTFQIVFDPASRWVAVAGLDGHVDLWDLPSGARRFRARHGGAAFTAAALSPDGERLATASVDGVLRILEVKTGALLARFDGHDGGVSAVAFTPSGASLVSATTRGSVYRWRAAPQGLRAQLGGALLGARDDARAVVLRDASGARSLTFVDGERPPVPLGAHGQASVASFSPDGQLLATSLTRDGALSLELRAAGDDAAPTEIPLPMWGSVLLHEWSDDGALLLAAANNKSGMAVIDVAKRAVAKQLELEFYAITPEFALDGRRLVTQSSKLAPSQFVLHVWDTRTWEDLARRPGAPHSSAHGVNHAGTTLARTGLENVPELINLETGALIRSLSDPAGPLPPFSSTDRYRFSHDDAVVASAHLDGTARLWQTADGALRATLRGHGASVISMAMDPAGPRLVTCSADGTAIVWSTESGERLSTLDPASASLSAVEFTPDGAHVIASGGDNNARLWHIETGRLITRLRGEPQRPARADDRLLTWDRDHGAGYLWDLTPETRSAAQLDELIARRVPWTLERGQLRPR